MCKVDKFEELNLIVAAFQQFGTDGIGQQSAETLFYNAVIAEDFQIFAFELIIEFMLTAGDGKDVAYISFYRMEKRVIRGSVVIIISTGF